MVVNGKEKVHCIVCGYVRVASLEKLHPKEVNEKRNTDRVMFLSAQQYKNYPRTCTCGQDSEKVA